MFTVLKRILSFFLQYTDIWDRFSYLGAYERQIAAIVFVLAILAGFYVYRAFFSFTFFYIFVTLSVFLIAPLTSWQNTVAFFSVVGVTFAFLSFQWNRLAAITLCAVICGMCGWLYMPELIGGGLTPELIGAVLGAVLGGLLAAVFPVIALCVLMPLFGALGLCELYALPTRYTLAAWAAGTLLQFLLARKQTQFPKPYPDRIRYYLEKRKIKHAAGV